MQEEDTTVTHLIVNGEPLDDAFVAEMIDRYAAAASAADAKEAQRRKQQGLPESPPHEWAYYIDVAIEELVRQYGQRDIFERYKVRSTKLH